MLQVLLVLLGGALSIAGGMFAARFQINRADDVAREIRRAERQEQALLVMHSKAAEVYDSLASMHPAALAGQMDTSQYAAPRMFLRPFDLLWLADCAALIRDRGINDAYAALDKAARKLPENNNVALDRYLAESDLAENFLGDRRAEVGERFAGDLGCVLAKLAEFKREVRQQLDELTQPKPKRTLWKRKGARLPAGRHADTLTEVTPDSR